MKSSKLESYKNRRKLKSYKKLLKSYRKQGETIGFKDRKLKS